MEERTIIQSIRKIEPTRKVITGILLVALFISAFIPPMGYLFHGGLWSLLDAVPWYFGTFGWWIFAGIMLLCFLFFWGFSKCELVVTNKRIVGRSTFRRTIDIPVDSISAVGTGMMSSIVISSSSGKIHFSLIKNYLDIYKQISDLIIARQTNVINERGNTDDLSTPKQSVADELRQFKALLDEGLITKDEYDAKKQKLLNN